MRSKPIVVDLDGTLIRSDLLVESGFAFLKCAPHRFYEPLVWLVRGGKPSLKAKLAECTAVDVTVLPYDKHLLEWLRAERAAGRTLVLAAGDLDEAISGLLTNHLVASDAGGVSVPAGFTRIVAFRSGLVGNATQCYGNFP